MCGSHVRWGGVPGPSFPGPSSRSFWGRGVPGPSFPGPFSSPSQLVLPDGGYLGPPSQVLPAVLPSWSLGGGYSSPPSQVLPSVLPSWSFQRVPCDLSHNALGCYLFVLQCIMGKVTWPPGIELNRLANTTENITFLQTTYAGGKNDADELLKDQCRFGIENKEIQYHLLGEISESDNSIKVLYEARKVESKLSQRKMLGIVKPSVVSIDVIKRNSKYSDKCDRCDYCGQNHTGGKQNCPALGNICIKCSGKNHFKTMRKSRDGSKFDLI